ncbi:hypothetical protein Ddye_009633 [Dipteronia dyeriana]|uniref:Uncharacterized protein n=1 Tax=Dipteronia dyeriana TaxID=168575 RepID=A0AAD9XBQ5_9ROSI|nr:hypothetical protein Ddye_009633 [Dipteronia dyeriana]
MERVYEELDKVKVENEKLRADYKSKAELCDNLKKAHSEQLIQIQEANSKVEKQAQELIEKSNEISKVKQLFEDHKRNLIEKESIIKRLSAANDKLRVDSDEKNRKWEEGNRGLVLALDEANEKNIDQAQKINVFKAEIEGLKGLLAASQKKCLEAERKAKASKELRERDDVLLKLEEDNKKVEVQLKWKKEQFKHLEEAHAKLQDQFKASKKEWEQERSTLVVEICSLQTSLDSQTRISGDLQNRLQMCNYALAHEESRRKCLEVQVSEFRTRFESTFAEYQDAKSKFECLTDQRDRDIAALRHSLGTKGTFYKEMEYRAGKLESENQDLLSSLKELQEAQIHSAGSSSLAKLRNKLRNVEQVHRDCSVKLRAKEAEWSSQLEKLDRERNDYRSELERKDATLEELKMELESCQSLTLQLKMQNEEISVMLLVLKAAVSEAELKLAHVENDRDLHNKEREEHVSLLMMQLEMKTAALSKAQTDIEEEREKTTSLLRRIESSNLIEEQGLLMQKELDRYKEMLDESAKRQFQLKEKALQIESEFKEKLREFCDALDSANLDLAKEREKTASLSRAVESFDHIEEEQRFPMQIELEKYKEMLEESSRSQIHLKEQVAQMECDSEEKLREVCEALDAAKLELAEQREKAACLSRRVNSLDHIEEQNLLMQKELEKYTEMVEESSRCQIHLKEQIVQKECDSKEKLREVCDA